VSDAGGRAWTWCRAEAVGLRRDGRKEMGGGRPSHATTANHRRTPPHPTASRTGSWPNWAGNHSLRRLHQQTHAGHPLNAGAGHGEVQGMGKGRRRPSCRRGQSACRPRCRGGREGQGAGRAAPAFLMQETRSYFRSLGGGGKLGALSIILSGGCLGDFGASSGCGGRRVGLEVGGRKENGLGDGCPRVHVRGQEVKLMHTCFDRMLGR
jgi:hypothetical protein